ncbi:ADP-ribosylation [Pholiota conissans]|uniref:ADP-ribosylation n=1 Tax=Pholiota conissans TaxID=109636 RepID=A0A9P5YXC5_9AGAR|nr:ADP-ribosylation [Pholiota conissans]
MAYLQHNDDAIHGQAEDSCGIDNTFDDEDGDEDIVEQSIQPQETYYPGINVCIVCEKRPPYLANGRSYPTCGLTCARVFERLRNSTALPIQPSSPSSSDGSTALRIVTQRNPPFRRISSSIASPSSRRHSAVDNLTQRLDSLAVQNSPIRTEPASRQVNNFLPCVVCLVGYCRNDKYVTCTIACAEKLCKTGSANPTMCNYCHRHGKVTGKNQCEQCIELAKVACLLCKSRPKFKRYHLCGKTCKTIATKLTPLILEAPAGHATYEFVENKFKDSWKYPGTSVPTVKNIFKIIEGKDFLEPYDKYKKLVGNEVFRYHGTTRQCTLGSGNNTQLCANTACALCSILKTSFKTSLANPGGAFGPGIYSSSASNKAYSYTSSGSGAIILTKVILGIVRAVSGWKEVTACPPGSHSVVFDRQNGSLNETIVYSDDAIRPVFLITF